ncbi:response regulator [Novosphingobium sp. PY1]|uniref:response regulator n=1 Tax=Novosphingobium sp. PY1 TaxID=1882221 RepID=UPI001A8C90AD|nr:response regulator [Novosphingobium sp. PY1]
MTGLAPGDRDSGLGGHHVEDLGPILLVEDNPGDADYIEEILSDQRSQLIHATSIARATEVLRDGAVNAVLLDLGLPDGNGVECVHAIRGVASDAPIVVLTGLDEERLALQCLEAGAQDYIPKSDLKGTALARAIRYAAARTREASERLRAEQLHALLAGIVEASDDAVFSGGPDGTITSWNPAAERIFGYSSSEAIGTRAHDLLRAVDVENAVEQRGILAVALQGGSVGEHEIGLLARDGRQMTLSMVAFGLPDAEGAIQQFGAICRDVTEKRRQEAQMRAQFEMLKIRDRQMRQLTARLNTVREEEQKRIAREVHDELGQLLTALKMDVWWMNRKLDAGTPLADILVPKLNDASELIDATIETVRRIAAQLRPSALDVLGLAAAVEDEARRFELRTGLTAECRIDESDLPRSEIATAFFRVLQEMLTNIIRHAQASHVRIEFTTTEDEWRLTVTDDGKGFAEIPKEETSLGLLGMRERVELFGGSIRIAPNVPTGAQVTARVPR